MASYSQGVLKYLTLSGRVCTKQTILSACIPCQKNSDLKLFAKIHSVVRSNIEDKILPTQNKLFFQSDLFNRLVITRNNDKQNFIRILNIKCHMPICKRYKKCLCKPQSSKVKVFSLRHKYYKIIRKKFCKVSLIIISDLKETDFNHFDISVTLKFCKMKK